MASRTSYNLLDSLAVSYIPEGRHKYLHVDSREVWVDIMSGLIKKGFIQPKKPMLAKCAKNWEFMLITKLSILN